MHMPALTVHKIHKKFGSFEVLKGASFDVDEGKIFGLLGPNGAGKSTIIKILMGFEEKDSGEFSFFLNNRKLTGKEILERVSIIPQELCFYRAFSSEKNLKTMGALYGLNGKALNERVEFLLEQWNLKRHRKKVSSMLSGGYKRLLNIACGLINDPDIIFLDEPTVGLDPKIRKAFWTKILELKKAGKTIILTTHYMDEAEFLCDEIAVIINGGIATELKVEKLKKEGISVEDIFLKIVEKEGIKREDI